MHLLAALCGLSVYWYSCAEEDLLEKKMIAALAWPVRGRGCVLSA